MPPRNQTILVCTLLRACLEIFVIRSNADDIYGVFSANIAIPLQKNFILFVRFKVPETSRLIFFCCGGIIPPEKFFKGVFLMKHVLSVCVENQPGVLVRVASMFSRREFNIDSLSVGVTQSPEFSRITVVVYGDSGLVEQMIKQLEKMPVVRAVQRLDSATAVTRGMTMIKVSADDDNRLDVLKMAELFRAHVVDVQPTTLIFEITGNDEKVTAFTRLLAPYGILEVIRTGLIALERGENTINNYNQVREYYGKNLL